MPLRAVCVPVCIVGLGAGETTDPLRSGTLRKSFNARTFFVGPRSQTSIAGKTVGNNKRLIA